MDLEDIEIARGMLSEIVSNIAEFGEHLKVAVWIKTIDGIEYISNFDYIVDEDPVDEMTECAPDEVIRHYTLGQLLIMFEGQTKLMVETFKEMNGIK